MQSQGNMIGQQLQYEDVFYVIGIWLVVLQEEDSQRKLSQLEGYRNDRFLVTYVPCAIGICLLVEIEGQLFALFAEVFDKQRLPGLGHLRTDLIWFRIVLNTGFPIDLAIDVPS